MQSILIVRYYIFSSFFFLFKLQVKQYVLFLILCYPNVFARCIIFENKSAPLVQTDVRRILCLNSIRVQSIFHKSRMPTVSYQFRQFSHLQMLFWLIRQINDTSLETRVSRSSIIKQWWYLLSIYNPCGRYRTRNCIESAPAAGANAAPFSRKEATFDNHENYLFCVMYIKFWCFPYINQ